MKMKDFYLTLLSDSSLNMFPNNKQSEFTVRLDYPIQIEGKMGRGLRGIFVRISQKK